MKYNLSEINALIRSRRTIYPEQFSSRKVQQDQLEQILNNAIWAPTHGNTQPWRFTVFTADSRQDLADFLAEAYVKNTPPEKQNDQKLAKLIKRPLLASAAIVVSMKRDPNGKISEVDEIAAVSCAIQNMHLTCTAYGIGAFWASPGVIQSPDMKKFLGLEDTDRCLAIFYIGYPAIEWPQGQRKPIEYLTEWRN